MRIVQLADLHFGTEDPRAIDAAASRIDGLEPDVIVVSGDMTQRGKHREFQAARDWIETLGRAPAVQAPPFLFSRPDGHAPGGGCQH